MTPEVTSALETLASAAISTVATAAVAVAVKLFAYFGHAASATDKSNMEADITAALNVGVAQVLPDLLQKGWHDPAVLNDINTAATAYLSQRFPKRFAQIANAAGAKDDAARVIAVSQTVSGRLPNLIPWDALLAGAQTAAQAGSPVQAVALPAPAPSPVTS